MGAPFKTNEQVIENIVNNTVENSEGCWLWTKSCFKGTNYGQQKWKGKNWHVHRLAYTLFKGDIPDGLVVRHRCGNQRCCNPLHLELGTHKDNSADTRVHGRCTFTNLDQDGSNNIGAKLTEDQVYEMRLLAMRAQHCFEDLGKLFGVSRKCAERTCNGIAYSCYTKVPPFDWRELDTLKFKKNLTNKGLELAEFCLKEGATKSQMMELFDITPSGVYSLKNRFGIK